MNFLVMIPALLGQLPEVDSADFSKQLQKKALLATVRIVNVTANDDGTGVIVGRKGPFVYILTAKHVVHGAKKLEIHVFDDESYPKPARKYTFAEVLGETNFRNSDVALVQMLTKDELSKPMPVAAVSENSQKKTMPALSIGCDGGRPPTCVVVEVQGKKLVARKGQPGAAFFWQVNHRPLKGRSGGPLIDKKGQVLGVCSFAGDNAGYYCHIEEIHRFLKSQDMEWLIAK